MSKKNPINTIKVGCNGPGSDGVSGFQSRQNTFGCITFTITTQSIIYVEGNLTEKADLNK